MPSRRHKFWQSDAATVLILAFAVVLGIVIGWAAHEWVI